MSLRRSLLNRPLSALDPQVVGHMALQSYLSFRYYVSLSRQVTNGRQAYRPVNAFRSPFLNESFMFALMKFLRGAKAEKIFRSIAGRIIASTLRVSLPSFSSPPRVDVHTDWTIQWELTHCLDVS